MVLDDLAAAIKGLVALEVDALGASELDEAIGELARLRTVLEAVEARMLSRWDASREWQASGARTSAACLAWRTRLPAAECGRRIRHARQLRTLPKVAEAWEAGEIDRAHVQVLLKLRNPRTAEAFEESHGHLLDIARRASFLEFERDCETWLNLADQDGAERRDADELASRSLHFNQSIGGMWFGKITSDPVSGEIFQTTLREIEDELYLADRAEARERLGRNPMAFELGRSPEQRRHDALIEMAIRAKTARKDGRRPKPLFTVVSGREAFDRIVELWSRRVLNPAAAARWLQDADLEPILFDGEGRVLDVGRQRRFYRGALRRAIEVRDRSCFHPSCDESPRWPQVDHEEEASKGGETTQDNGRLGCDFHNNRRNTHPDDWGEADLCGAA